MNHRGIHNFCLGTLVNYFYLHSPRTKTEFLEDGKVLVLSHLPGRNPEKAFVFDCTASVELLHELQKLMVVYSIDQVALKKESQFVELVYDLQDVFDERNYKNRRKRHQRLKYPFVWYENHNFRIDEIQKSDVLKVKELHEQWCNFKLSQPDTFKMMFPKSRYFQCVVTGLNSKDYIVYGVFNDSKLVAVRVLYIDNNQAFDLAFFGRTWDQPSQLMEYSSTIMMGDLHFGRKIQTLNCGAQLNRKLHNFKSHWPHKELVSYMYSRIKV